VGVTGRRAVAGCAGGRETPSPTTVSTVDAVASCTTQLVYWTEDILGNARDDGLDYQEMGLTGDQYEALQALVDEARKHQSGGTVPPDWLRDQAKAACAKLAAAPKPTTSAGLGWP
jgi:hypothetical protein